MARKVTGVPIVWANTRFSPTFTHRVAYGVLDLPGFDGLLGVGFLHKFMPYAISVKDAATKVVSFTNARSKEVVTVPGVPILAVESQMFSATQSDNVSGDAPVISVQWEPPSADDLQGIIGRFHLGHDPVSGAALLEQIPEDDSLFDLLRLDALLSPDEAEGFVFLATHAAALPADKYNQVPLEQRTQLQHLLEQFRASVFKECEFPPFPPKREVEFQIQLEPGAQIPS